MIEFRKLPRGTYRAALDGWELDVWQVGGGWRWTALGPDGRYDGGGIADTQDAACDAALACAHI